MTATIERKFIVNSAGEPQEVIIPWAAYVEMAETMGWDLSDAEQSHLTEALRDSREGNRAAFISIDDLE